MNKVIVALVILIALVGGFFILNSYIYQEKQADEVAVVSPERDVYLEQFEDPAVELAFDYLGGPDGYIIDDLSDFSSEESQTIEVVKMYRIMNKKEKFELENSEVAREGSPAIQVTVFRNDQNQSADVWIDSYPQFSNISLLLDEVSPTEIAGGVNAIRYRTDGLYVSDNVVVANGDFIYHFIGSYLEPDSFIHQDFKGIVDSVRFIPRKNMDVEVGARIDVQAACENALAYMLFQTGEAADQFVAECVAGEHPDVIESYIDDMGSDGA